MEDTTKMRKKKAKRIRPMAGLEVLAVIGLAFFVAGCSHKEEVYSDVSQYPMFRDGENILDYFRAYGKNYLEQAQMEDVNIWPETISNNVTVQDYTLVYAEPWDANYLGYLKIEYEKEEYLGEAERLGNYPSTEYKGVYGAEGFTHHELLAINASDSGFVYALTDGQETIIYIGMIFPGYGMDIDYKKYIPEEYLPEGLDATKDNPTRKAVIERNEKTK